MDRSVWALPDDEATMAPGNSVKEREIRTLFQSGPIRQVVGIGAPVVLGLLLGAVVVFSRRLPPEWAGLVILVTAAPTVVLAAKDIRRLVLVVLVIDIPLGLDIALAQRPEHRGGPGGFLISLMTFALVVGYAQWLMAKPETRRSHNSVPAGIAVPALVFTFTVLVSSWQANELWFSITQVFLQLQFLLMFFFVALRVESWADVRLVANTLAVCLLLESILMLLQFFGGFEFSALGIRTQVIGEATDAATRVGGTFSGPNLAATFLAACLAITLAAYLTDGRLMNRGLALVSFIVGLLALVTTQSRSGWIGFVVALLIVAIRGVSGRVGLRRVLALLFVFGLVAVGSSTLIAQRFASEDRGSAESRIWHSQMALNIIQDHLFTGVGTNNQQFAIESGNYTPAPLWGKEDEISGIHNTYLATWVETGLFGFLAFGWLLLGAGGAALYASLRARDRYVSLVFTGLLAALAVHLVHMLTATFTGRRMQLLWLLFALISATIQIARKTEGLEDPMRRPS